MNRSTMLTHVSSRHRYDLIIIGGGATGLGIALEAASRGYQTLLLEKHDFAQETSSRSTKLIHGGIRYLRHGQFSLVREALQERAFLMENAPHLVHPLSFILPIQNRFKGLYYYAGMKLYDFLGGKLLQKGKSNLLSKKMAVQRLPAVNKNLLQGGIEYVDGQFDDSRLAINLLQTFVEQGGIGLNYMPVIQLMKEKKNVIGVIAQDLESGQTYEIRARGVINAAGAFVDVIRSLDDHTASPLVAPSQGAHIVLKRSFFPGDAAMIIPQTSDGRVLFFIPWKKHVIVGTTETPLDKAVEEPKPLDDEIEYLLKYAGMYLNEPPGDSDILSAFAGIRPLFNPKKDWKHTSSLSRDYRIIISESGLINVIGGKWTTYRSMGENTIDQAVSLLNLPKSFSRTKHLPIHGSLKVSDFNQEWFYYGSDALFVTQLAKEDDGLLKKLHPQLPCRSVDVIWATRKEMARRVEDVLSRRTRCLLLGARASVEIAPQVASLMAKELGYPPEWEVRQVAAYRGLAKRYTIV